MGQITNQIAFDFIVKIIDKIKAKYALKNRKEQIQ